MNRNLLLIACITLVMTTFGQTGPLFESWITNDNGEGGLYYETTQLTNGQNAGPNFYVVRINGKRYKINKNPIETTDSSNVTRIAYSDDYVYVWSTGVASYAFGPYIYDGNTNSHEKVDHLWQIPRSPEKNNGKKTTATLGNLAVFINGVPYFPPADNMYFYDQGGVKIWKRNAGVIEAAGFDCSGGHPAGEYYHYHRIPSPDVVHGIDSMCATFPSEGLFRLDETKHSPIIGWGFDGFPIYGPYGYTDSLDASSPIERMKSSWQKRNYIDGKRQSYIDEDSGNEIMLNPTQHGPDVDETVNGTNYPLGAFFEDYIYVEGSGDLNRYNLRWCVTPEYPSGTYAYFATVEEDRTPAFPYVMGEELFGKAIEENLSGLGGGNLSSSVVVNESVTTFFPSTITSTTHSNAANDMVNIYPNPASNFATINLTNMLQ